jgi:hypothetical protein
VALLGIQVLHELQHGLEELAHVASAGVVVGHLVAAPNVGKRASKSPCRWRHDLANHRSPMAHTCTPPTNTSMILRRSLLRAECVGMSSLAAATAVVASAPVKTGRKKRMKEPYIEGVATHDDPESCAGVREGVWHSASRPEQADCHQNCARRCWLSRSLVIHRRLHRGVGQRWFT